MAFRRFVVDPAAEIAPEMVHPQIGWTIGQLRNHLRTALPYVAITGGSLDEPSLACRENLAAECARATGWCALPGGFEFSAFAGANSPSPTLPAAIEFLRTSCALLARDNFPNASASAGVITPFWMEEILALGDVLWPGELDRHWRQISLNIVPPKLLVICDSTAKMDSMNHSDSTNRGDLPAQFARALLARAARNGLGPTLSVSLADPAAAQIELTAAIQAMS